MGDKPQEDTFELTDDEITTLKRISNGATNGTEFTDAELAPLLQAGYVEEYIRPVLSITDDGVVLLNKLQTREICNQ